MNMTFYKLWNDDIYFAVPDYGGSGIYRLFADKLANGWDYLPPYSDAWDSSHQRIFRQHDAEIVDPPALDFSFPDLPPIPDPPEEGWKEYFRPKAYANTSDYYNLFKFLSGRDSKHITVYVVLEEDLYESMSGDGKFLYLKDASLNGNIYKRYSKEPNILNGNFTRYHQRQFLLSWDDDFFFSNDFRPGIFENYELNEVLQILEK